MILADENEQLAPDADFDSAPNSKRQDAKLDRDKDGIPCESLC
ncbi:hypothetical protein EH240_32630 [Mesorhizobium tamadayense]|uniref:Excalibur calcium-binding domain-containing protein n=1 Tax=Mesorhizobium tamadayense TaxID=425306 RepID=A0A3P3EXR8_9HYPH|nr:hypothetical protein EH240_32630 [Mesorhizobium tamadayense]